MGYDIERLCGCKETAGTAGCLSDFAGLEAVVVDAEGERLTQGHDFQGEETDAYDIVVNGERLGAVVVSHSVDKKTKGAAWMLSTVISQAAGLEELDHKNTGRFDSVKDDIKKSGELVQMINEKTGHLEGDRQETDDIIPQCNDRGCQKR